MRHGWEGLKDIVEKEAEEEAKEQQQEKEGIDLTSHGHEKALKRAYRSFVILMHIKQILIVTLIKPNHTSRC